jgi:hypothetical protein
MIGVGSLVRVKAPFTEFFPGEYVVEAMSVTGAWQIAGGIDFDAVYLELVS